MKIRQSTDQDLKEIINVTKLAFARGAEADLVNEILTGPTAVLSLVAEIEGKLVGHILLSKMSVLGEKEYEIYGVAPMSVHPDFQKQHIGSQLMQASIDEAKNLQFDALFVLGHPTYYPKFGFTSTAQYQISSEYDVPDDVFMVLELKKDFLQKISEQRVCYCPAFRNFAD